MIDALTLRMVQTLARWVMWFFVAANLAVLLAVVIAFCAWAIRRAWRRWRGRGRTFALAMAGAVAAATFCAAPQKPAALTVAWDEPFIGGAAHVATNGVNVAEFSWRVAAGVPRIASADFFAVHRSQFSAAGTNDLFAIGSTVIGAEEFASAMAEHPTNYLYVALCDYIPPAPIRTNGVYHVKCVGGVDSRLVPIGLEFRTSETGGGSE